MLSQPVLQYSPNMVTFAMGIATTAPPPQNLQDNFLKVTYDFLCLCLGGGEACV